jgi:anti-sigma factor RsiW
MDCELWRNKIEAYVDGELTAAEERELSKHLRTCAACAAETLSRSREKQLVRMAANARFVPNVDFRARVEKTSPRRSAVWARVWVPVLALMAVLLVSASLVFIVRHQHAKEQELLAELADLHVTTIASANPVDVVSSDRHTVKPWFAGKIPFTFNLPELQGTPFTLVGGRLSYLQQSPGAELIFRVRQHQISVFIFQEKDLGSVAEMPAARRAQSFNIRSWIQDGLVYFAISDVNGADLDALSALMKAAH